MLSVALLTTCLISISSVKAMDDEGEGNSDTSKPNLKPVYRCPESPVKGGVENSIYHQRKVARHPDTYQLINGQLYINQERYITHANTKLKTQ